MKYVRHKIRKDGHINIQEKDSEGKIWGYVIPPNKPVEKYNEEIEADPDFEKYRTQENADAYKAKLAELEPTAEELEEQKKEKEEKEKRDRALNRLIEKEIKIMDNE